MEPRNSKSDCPLHATIVMTAYRGGQSMGVLIGNDPHKSVKAAAAIDEQGELAGHETFPANRIGLRALERWATGAARSAGRSLRPTTGSRLRPTTPTVPCLASGYLPTAPYRWRTRRPEFRSTACRDSATRTSRRMDISYTL